MRKLIFLTTLFIAQYVFAHADLAITLTGDQNVLSDSVHQYTLRISNMGNVVVKNGLLTMEIPEGAQVVGSSVVGSGGILTTCGIQASTFICSLGRVYRGANKAFNINLQIRTPEQTSTMVLTALVQHPGLDNTAANHTALLSVDVQGPVVIVEPPPQPIAHTISIQNGDIFLIEMCGYSETPITFSGCNATNSASGNLTFLANGLTNAGSPDIYVTYSQSSASELRFVDHDIYANNAVMYIAEGTAVSSNCFEGVVTIQSSYSINGTPQYGAFRACK